MAAKRITIQFPESDYAELKRFADQAGTSPIGLIRLWLEISQMLEGPIGVERRKEARRG